MNMHAQILEKDGKKEFVVIPYEEYLRIQELLEDLEDIRLLREAKAESYGQPLVSLEEVKKELEKE